MKIVKEEKANFKNMCEDVIYSDLKKHFIKIDNKIYQCFNTESRKDEFCLLPTNEKEMEYLEEYLEHKCLQKVASNKNDMHRLAYDGLIGKMKENDENKMREALYLEIYNSGNEISRREKIRLVELLDLNTCKNDVVTKEKLLDFYCSRLTEFDNGKTKFSIKGYLDECGDFKKVNYKECLDYAIINFLESDKKEFMAIAEIKDVVTEKSANVGVVLRVNANGMYIELRPDIDIKKCV